MKMKKNRISINIVLGALLAPCLAASAQPGAGKWKAVRYGMDDYAFKNVERRFLR